MNYFSSPTSSSIRVPVPNDFPFLINVPTLPVILPQRLENVLVRRNVMFSQEILQGDGSFFCVVVRDLGGYVVEDVSFGNPVQEIETDWTEE